MSGGEESRGWEESTTNNRGGQLEREIVAGDGFTSLRAVEREAGVKEKRVLVLKLWVG